MKICQKLSYILKWSPAARCLPISHSHLQCFNIFYEGMLAEKYWVLYLFLAVLSIVVLAVVNTVFYIKPISVGNLFGLNIICAGSIVYHSVLFVLFKIDGTRKVAQKYAFLCNLSSFIILVILTNGLSFYLSPNNPINNVESTFILESIIVIFFFQTSFVISTLLWVLSTGTSYIASISFTRIITAPVVSFYVMCKTIRSI